MADTHGKITLVFNTSRFGVKLADNAFDAGTMIGEVHARLRKKLLKGTGVDKSAAPTPTYVFLKNGTEAFIPAPDQTLEELFEVYVEGKVKWDRK